MKNVSVVLCRWCLLLAGCCLLSGVGYAQSGKWQIQYDREADQVMGLGGKTLRGSFLTLSDCETYRKSRSVFEQTHCKCVRSDVTGLALPLPAGPVVPEVASVSAPAPAPVQVSAPEPAPEPSYSYTEPEEPDYVPAPYAEAFVSADTEEPTLSWWDLAYTPPIVPHAPESLAQSFRVELQTGHTDLVNELAFSYDGRFIASAGADRVVILRDASTLQEIRRFSVFRDRVSAVCFTRDGRFLVTGDESYGCNVRMWDVSQGTPVRCYEGAEYMIFSVAVSPDDRVVAAASGDYIYLWDTQSGALLDTLKGGQGWVRKIVFSPDGASLFSAGDDKIIRMWNVSTGQVTRSFSGHSEIIFSLAVSPDGSLLVSGSYDQSPVCWDIASGTIRETLPVAESATIAFSPDGSRLVVGGYQHLVLWDLSRNKKIRMTNIPAGWIRAAAFSPDGQTIATGADNGAVSLWKASGKPLVEPGSVVAQVETAAVSSDGSVLVSARSDGIMDEWFLSGAAREHHRSSPIEVDVMLVTSGGLQTITGGWSGEQQATAVMVWDSYSKEPAGVYYIPGSGSWVSAMALSPDEEEFVWAADNDVYLSAVANAALILSIPDAHEVPVASVQVNDRFILTVDQRDQLKVWDRSSRALLLTLENTKGLLSQDGEHILLVSPGGGAGKMKIEMREGVDNVVHRVYADYAYTSPVGTSVVRYHYMKRMALSADNRYLIWSDDEELHVLDVAYGKELYSFQGHTAEVRALGFCGLSSGVPGEGPRAFSCSQDGTIRFWSLTTWKEAARMVVFSDQEWLVVTPEGFYNASEHGAEHLLLMRDGVAVEPELMERQYLQPRLVQQALTGPSWDYVDMGSAGAPAFIPGSLSVLVLLLLVVVFFLVSLIDILRHDFKGASKGLWLAVIFLPLAGPVIYFLAGRKSRIMIS